MNAWIARDNTKNGVAVSVSGYPAFSFQLLPPDPTDPRIRRGHLALSSDPKFADYLKRAGVAGYVPTADDLAIDTGYQSRFLRETLLVGWQGVTDRAGKPMKFNPLNVAAFFDHFDDIERALLAVAPGLPVPEVTASVAKQVDIATGN